MDGVIVIGKSQNSMITECCDVCTIVFVILFYIRQLTLHLM